MKVVNFPWKYFLDEENKEIWVHIPGGYPTTLALPIKIQQFFPGYKGHICSENFLNSLKKNHEQKTSS